MLIISRTLFAKRESELKKKQERKGGSFENVFNGNVILLEFLCVCVCFEQNLYKKKLIIHNRL